MANQSVTIGRIVRYVEDEQVWPSIITHVHGDTLVDLQVFKSREVTPRHSVRLDPTGKDDVTGSNTTWHWPERG